MSNKSEIMRIFQLLSVEKQKELLASVCYNMICNKAWDDIAELTITQLGDGDALEVVKMYAS